MSWIAIEYTRIDDGEREALNHNPDVRQHAHGETPADVVRRLSLTAEEALGALKALVWRLPDETLNQLKMHGISAIQRERKATIDRLKQSEHGSLANDAVNETVVVLHPVFTSLDEQLIGPTETANWNEQLEQEARLQGANGPQ